MKLMNLLPQQPQHLRQTSDERDCYVQWIAINNIENPVRKFGVFFMPIYIVVEESGLSRLIWDQEHGGSNPPYYTIFTDTVYFSIGTLFYSLQFNWKNVSLRTKGVKVRVLPESRCLWCNGNMTDCESVVDGSNPSLHPY